MAVYVELQPMDRHRPFIDHLFILRDRGRLTGIGRNLFASPFSEIALVGRHPDDDSEDIDRHGRLEGVSSAATFRTATAPAQLSRLDARNSIPTARSRYGRCGARRIVRALQRKMSARARKSVRSDHRRPGCLDRASSQPPVQRRPVRAGQPRRRAPRLWTARYRRWDRIAAFALPRWPRPPASFPARCSAIFASVPGLRPSDMQPCSGSAARCSKLPLEVEVWRISRRKRAIAIKRI